MLWGVFGRKAVRVFITLVDLAGPLLKRWEQYTASLETGI